VTKDEELRIEGGPARLWRNEACMVATGVWRETLIAVGDTGCWIRRMCGLSLNDARGTIVSRLPNCSSGIISVSSAAPMSSCTARKRRTTSRSSSLSKFFSALRRFDLNRPFLPWLYRIVHNISVDYLKRNRRAGETTPVMDGYLDTLMGPDPDPGPADHAEQSELRRAIWQAMERLPVNQRSVLMLCYYADLHEQEMSTALRVRPGTVKSRLHRARQALRDELTRGEHALTAEYTRYMGDGARHRETAQGGGE